MLDVEYAEVEQERLLYATSQYTGSRDYCKDCESVGSGCRTEGPCAGYRYKHVSIDMKS